MAGHQWTVTDEGGTSYIVVTKANNKEAALFTFYKELGFSKRVEKVDYVLFVHAIQG